MASSPELSQPLGYYEDLLARGIYNRPGLLSAYNDLKALYETGKAMAARINELESAKTETEKAAAAVPEETD